MMMTPTLLQTVAGAIARAEDFGLFCNLSADWLRVEYHVDGAPAEAWLAMLRQHGPAVVEVLRECRIQAELAVERIMEMETKK